MESARTERKFWRELGANPPGDDPPHNPDTHNDANTCEDVSPGLYTAR